ncbi:hypothetical protein AAFF_G00185410 [Aldrovandia affinis]|uniref:Uncharacterized protein n=1 Tax=Aldrovandia affinis TaxID=143900 RepID=A0AAD7RK47_9TELE|nr:hypothetical protein AAFF_G00185410 [Aldrovandia affinis]
MSRGVGVKIPSSLPVTSTPNHLITWRLAFTLSQLYLPPNPLLPAPSELKLKKGAPPHPVNPNQEALTPLRLNKKKVAPPRGKKINSKQTATHDTFRQQNLVGAVTLDTFIDFNTRTRIDLMKIVEDQWQKERREEMAEEKEAEKGEHERQRRDEEEYFREIREKRMEKVKKNTNPYELPGSKTLYDNR